MPPDRLKPVVLSMQIYASGRIYMLSIKDAAPKAKNDL